MIQEEILNKLNVHIEKSIVSVKHHLSKLRTGRANLSILDDIRIDYYGTPTLISQCAQLTISDGRTITIKPWEKNIISEIEKSILQTDIGITPQNDGEMIRLPFPTLTEERRKELVKQAKARGEEGKISLRNHRRDTNDILKEIEKEKNISEDELKIALNKVQDIIKNGNTKIDLLLQKKEKEILEI